MRDFLRRLARYTVVTTLVVALLILLATALTARRGDPALYPPAPGEATVRVYLIYNWMHSTLVLPTDAFAEDTGATARALAEMSDRPWVQVGFGDHRYYQQRGITPVRALDFARSMFRPNNPSVVSLNPIAETPSPQTRGRPVLRLTLSQRGFDALKRRLDASFVLDDGRPVRVGRGRSPDSWFFQSTEGSDLRHQCNHWIASLLNTAGIPVLPVVATLTAGLAWDLRVRAGAERVEGPLVEPDEPETPPIYSGTFRPLSQTAQAVTQEVTFDAYTLRFGSGRSYATAPIRLAEASETLAEGRSFAEVLEVPPDSLIELRQIEGVQAPPAPAAGMCGSRPSTVLALGFRKPSDAPYEIAIAAFAASPEVASSLCGVFQYVQP